MGLIIIDRSPEDDYLAVVTIYVNFGDIKGALSEREIGKIQKFVTKRGIKLTEDINIRLILKFASVNIDDDLNSHVFFEISEDIPPAVSSEWHRLYPFDVL